MTRIPDGWNPHIVKMAAADGSLKARCTKRGITVRDFLEMYHEQQGRCAVCREVRGYPALVIDHNHESGRVRGLLCSQCNSALGLLADRWDYAERAADYLKRKGSSHRSYENRTSTGMPKRDQILARLEVLSRYAQLTRPQREEVAGLRSALEILENAEVRELLTWGRVELERQAS